jgi:hypothetical protein
VHDYLLPDPGYHEDQDIGKSSLYLQQIRVRYPVEQQFGLNVPLRVVSPTANFSATVNFPIYDA